MALTCLFLMCLSQFLLFELAHNTINKPWLLVRTKATEYGLSIKTKTKSWGYQWQVYIFFAKWFLRLSSCLLVHFMVLFYFIATGCNVPKVTYSLKKSCLISWPQPIPFLEFFWYRYWISSFFTFFHCWTIYFFCARDSHFFLSWFLLLFSLVLGEHAIARVFFSFPVMFQYIVLWLGCRRVVLFRCLVGLFSRWRWGVLSLAFQVIFCPQWWKVTMVVEDGVLCLSFFFLFW